MSGAFDGWLYGAFDGLLSGAVTNTLGTDESPVLGKLAIDRDAAARLGYTGAVLQRTLGTDTGRFALVGALALWTIVPPLIAGRTFARKDF